MQKKEKIVYILVIIILVFFNINLILKEDKIVSTKNYESYNPVSSNINIKLPNNIDNKELKLLLVYQEQGCKSCIIEMINQTKLLNKENEHRIINIYSGMYEQDLFYNNLGLRFDYKVPSMDELGLKDITPNQPVACLLNKNNEVILFFVPKPGDELETKIFFKTVEKIFKATT